jgi:hypothetical protein
MPLLLCGASSEAGRLCDGATPLGVERFAHRMLILHLLRKVPAHALGLAAVRSRLRAPGDSVGASDGRGRVGVPADTQIRILSHLWAPERHRPCSAFICAGWPPGAVLAPERTHCGRHTHSVWHKEHGQPKTMPLRMRGSLLPLACDILD